MPECYRNQERPAVCRQLQALLDDRSVDFSDDGGDLSCELDIPRAFDEGESLSVGRKSEMQLDDFPHGSPIFGIHRAERVLRET